MMQVESLVKLIGSGNTSTVEEEWMKMVDAVDVPLSKLAEYAAVLEALVKAERLSTASDLAWAAIEAIALRHTPRESLDVAGPFLLAVGNGSELRSQVADLYRKAYEDVHGLDALLDEAGIQGGRPVRRALRTLEVCLQVRKGDFLAARHEEGAARVKDVDRSAWEFTIELGKATETLGAVHLADAYEPADQHDFWVQRVFAKDEVIRRLNDDPAGVVLEICRPHDNKSDSDRLERLLVPDLLTTTEWKKWWPKARTALKRYPQVRLDGRAPVQIAIFDEPVSAEEPFLATFRKSRDPLKQYDVVEKYVRDCTARQERPSDDAMRVFRESFELRAERLSANRSATAALYWIIAARIARLAGEARCADGALDLFRHDTELRAIFDLLDNDVLVDVACDCLVAARPDDWQDCLLELLPTLPMASCDKAAARLIDGGKSVEELDVAVQRTLSDAVRHFEALLWLWDGPSTPAIVEQFQPITILMRILRALNDARLSDETQNATVTRMGGRVRAVLAARKYERFERCLNEVDRGMAHALKNQLKRNESLGRTVREELLKRIAERFPALEAEPEIAPWSRNDVIFVTDAGLARKQREVEEHVNVKMKENARAIGAAAEHGDLSENSEYKFALEERDLLRARLAQMNSELAKAQVIDPADIPTDHVGVGTLAVFRSRTNGQDLRMSFVGPWEADVPNGRYNYAAPLAQRLMGKRIGDVVTLEHGSAEGEYEIIALHNAYED